MKPNFLLLAIIISYSSLFAQTKKIAHRSHSGNNKTFTTKGNSNFGLSPEMEKKREEIRRLEKMKKDSTAKADSIAKAKTAP